MYPQERDVEVHEPQNPMLRELIWLLLQKRNVCGQDPAKTVSQQDDIQIFRFMR